MKSIRDIYKIGKGPSSSHTMGPAKAMEIFLSEHPASESFEVVLYGSLADTGRGHGTDHAIKLVCGDKPVNIIFNNEQRNLPHENTMDIFECKGGKRIAPPMRVMSVGGGDIKIEDREELEATSVYPERSFSEIADFCKKEGIRLSDFVAKLEVALAELLINAEIGLAHTAKHG